MGNLYLKSSNSIWKICIVIINSPITGINFDLSWTNNLVIRSCFGIFQIQLYSHFLLINSAYELSNKNL